MLHGGSVACDADAAKIALSQALSVENKGTITISGVETVSSNKTKILCAARLQKDGGQSATVTYEILLGQPTKVSITSGLDKPTPADRDEAGSEEEKREIAADASPEDDERGCAQAEDSGLRVASCGRVIERGAGSADNRAEAYMHRGDAYFAMSDFGQAVLDYEQAIALSPNKPEGFIKQGDALAAGGEQAKALGSYEQAIRLDPKNAAVYDARGCSYVAAGVLAKAEADFRKAKGLGDKKPGEQCREAFAELRAKNDSIVGKKPRIRNDDYDTEKEVPSNR
jgi:tetratricopeptide (TPR) repeat protein